MAEQSSQRLETIAEGLYRFDTHYIRPRHTAVHVVVSGNEVAIVDCAVNANIEPLLEALAGIGIEPPDIGHVVITHAHMDHAGGAGTLIERLPSARLYAHPSAAKHMIDPSRLETGARAVFGDDFFEREYAPVKPVAAHRVVIMDDGDAIRLGERELRSLHTPGHAWHHQCLWEPASRSLFSGDAFGVGYPELTAASGPFFVPETPPPQFVPEEMHASIDRIVELEPTRVLPTHFDIVTDAGSVADSLRRVLDDSVARCRRVESQSALEAELLDAYADELVKLGRGSDDEVAQMRALYAFDGWLSSQGLWLWREKQAR